MLKSRAADPMDQSLSDVASRLLDRVDEIADSANARIMAEVGNYATSVPEEDLAGSGRNVIGFVLRRLAGMGSLDEAINLAVERGRRRQIQGVALEDVLRAVRLDFAALWEPVVEEAQQERDPSRVTALGMLRIWECLDEVMLALTEGFRYEETLQDRELLSRRTRVLHTLIYEAEHDGATLDHAAQVLAMNPEEQLLVTAARLGEGEESRLEMRWRSLGSSAHVTPVGDVVIGITSWSHLNRQVLHELVRDRPDRHAVLAPPVEGFAGVHVGIAIARAALGGAPFGVVSDAESLVVEAIVAESATVAWPLSQVRLKGLLDLPVAERERLLDTLDGWIRFSGTTAELAKHRHCHRNTVINHLRRVEEVTGLSLSCPADVASLVTALTSARRGRL